MESSNKYCKHLKLEEFKTTKVKVCEECIKVGVNGITCDFAKLAERCCVVIHQKINMLRSILKKLDIRWSLPFYPNLGQNLLGATRITLKDH